MPKFKIFPRYRRPSLNTLLGITKAKRQLKRDTGIAQIERVLNTPKNMERQALRRVGFYSEPMKFLRWLGHLFRIK